MTTKQISVFLENRPNSLAEFCKILEEHNIDMRAMCLADAMDFGILRMIVDETYRTMTVLKSLDYVCKITDVLAIEIDDRPGSLTHLLAALGERGVNLEYCYAFLSKGTDKACMILKLSDMQKSIEILNAEGVHIIPQEQLSRVFGD